MCGSLYVSYNTDSITLHILKALRQETKHRACVKLQYGDLTIRTSALDAWIVTLCIVKRWATQSHHQRHVTAQQLSQINECLAMKYRAKETLVPLIRDRQRETYIHTYTQGERE